MTDSISTLIADMARAGVDPDLIGRTAQMLAGAQLDGYLLAGVGTALGVIVTGEVTGDAVTSQASQGVTVATPVTAGVTRRNAASPGAIRTRRYRERLRLAALRAAGAAPQTIASQPVMTVTTVTPLPAAAEGTPLKGVQPPTAAARRKTPKPKDRSQRELVLMRSLPGGGASAGRTWLKGDNPILAEIEAAGGSLPRDRNGGWAVGRDAIAAAEARLRERTSAGGVQSNATGPPMSATG